MFSVHIIIIHRYVLEKYYTDHHDVDENRTTIPFIGGDYSWYRLTSTGKFSMELESDGLEPHDLVASKNNAQPPSKIGGYVMYCIIISPD